MALRTSSLLLLCGLILHGRALAEAPASRMEVLSHGLDISHWFRFPPDNTAAAMRAGLDDRAIASLRKAGFGFIRLPVGPEEVMQGDHIVPAKRDAIVAAMSRLEKAGLAVLVDPNPEKIENWDLERNAGARARLIGFWHDLAPALRSLPAGLTFPELVNEPVVEHPELWDGLQRRLLATIRAALPDNTVILTGTDWSSIDGLLKVQPVADPNVIYSFHTYEPQLLTLLAFWDPAAKPAPLAASLPFPVTDIAACEGEVAGIADAHTRNIARTWCATKADDASVERNLRRAAAWGHTHNVSVAMTEFGAVGILNRKARGNYLAAVRSAADRLHLPWALWALDDQMGFGQKPGGYRAGTKLAAPVVRALGLTQQAGSTP